MLGENTKFLFQRKKKECIACDTAVESHVHINVLLSPGPMKMVQKVSLGRYCALGICVTVEETYNF